MRKITPRLRQQTREASRRYRERHPARAREINRAFQAKWRRANHVAYLIRNAERRAIRLGLPFALSLEDVVIPDRCPYLGIAMRRSRKGEKRGAAPSIDRIDPAKGYVPGNVQVICQRANVMKGPRSHQWMLDYIKTL